MARTSPSKHKAVYVPVPKVCNLDRHQHWTDATQKLRINWSINFIRLLQSDKDQIRIKITTCDIHIPGYMSNVHCTGDSVVILHAFEIPPLPYSSGPCKFNFSIVLFLVVILWRHCGLMVIAPDSRSSGPGSSPVRGHGLLGQNTLQVVLTLPFSTQVYKISEYQQSYYWG